MRLSEMARRGVITRVSGSRTRFTAVALIVLVAGSSSSQAQYHPFPDQLDSASFQPEAHLYVEYSHHLAFPPWVALLTDAPLPAGGRDALRRSVQGRLYGFRSRWDGDWWIHEGFWRPRLRRKSLCVLSGEIDPSPLIPLLFSREPGRLDVIVKLPGVPIVTAPGTERFYNDPSRRTWRRRWYSSAATVHRPLSYRFGHPNQDLARAIAALFAILTIPPLLALWIRGRALRAVEVDRAAAWFGYWRMVCWLITSGWLIWLAAYAGMEVYKLMNVILINAPPVVATVGSFSALFLPPSIAGFSVNLLSQPVFVRVRGLTWTFRDTMTLAFWQQLAARVPSILVVSGIPQCLVSGRTAVMLFLGAFLSWLALQGQLQKVLDLIPHSVAVGDLRDRVFALAEKAGVKVQQLYYLPASDQTPDGQRIRRHRQRRHAHRPPAQAPDPA